jgi:UDP-N-acetylglucosamine--N-acetylmuramyl-(pentapeptide) pyrophosphoryl-undecaprenol N-acetylglucosamine transferase
MSRTTIVFCGGGSGGHLSPAIAIIEQLQKLRPDVHSALFCSHRPVDRQILEAAAPSLPALTWQPVVQIPRGSFPRRHLQGLLEIHRSKQSLLTMFRQLRPAVVVGLGAFASIPGVLAASRLKIPILLLEANTVPGRATRMLASRAARICAGLPLADNLKAKLRTTVELCGVPVRDAISDIARRPLPQSPDRRTLLVIGGSQGATRLNTLFLHALRFDNALPPGWKILHQAGTHDAERVRQLYREQALPAEVVEFLPNLPERLPEIGLAVSRAGAVTLAELACAAIPAILVPLASAADKHQQHNAHCMASAGMAAVVDESASTSVAARHLQSLLQEISHSECRLQHMAKIARHLATPDAAKVIATRLLQSTDPT